MEKNLVRIEEKIDRITEFAHANRITLVKNTATLEEHVRRTNLLEKQVAPMWITYKAIAGIMSLVFVAAALVGILSYFKK